MGRVYEVSFTVEADEGCEWKEPLNGSFKSLAVPYNVLSVRIPRDAKITEIVQTGYWRNRDTGGVFKYDNPHSTPTLHHMITNKPTHWERVEVRPV